MAQASTKIDQLQKANQGKFGSDNNRVLSQHEALRRATLLKHRKVSTQLKLDMVQRQLADLRRSTQDPDSDRQFYRLQMAELSSELQDLGSTLEKVERNAFYARRRMLRHCGMDPTLSLSASQPTIYSSNEVLNQTSARNGLRTRVCHLMSSPTLKFKKTHLLGELRAVASLSSLNIKSTNQTSYDDVNLSKDNKPWKGPLRFLGSWMDSRIRRKLWGSTKRTKSADNILEDKKPRRLFDERSKECNGFGMADSEDFSSSSDSSDSSDDDDNEQFEEWRTKSKPAHIWKAPVLRRVFNNQRAQVDPAVLAEIEDFEKMAAKYIKQHS